MTRVHTASGSIYEIEFEHMRVRLIDGRGTSRIPANGEWHVFQDVFGLHVGSCLLFIWNEELELDGRIRSRCTFTSQVFRVDHIDERKAS